MQPDTTGSSYDFELYFELSQLLANERAILDTLDARWTAGDAAAATEALEFDHAGLRRLGEELQKAKARALGQ